MKFKEITLYSRQLQLQKAFYTEGLTLPLLTETLHSFSIQAGHTLIHFIERLDAQPYHFAFNIPSFQEVEALKWLKARTAILTSEEEEIIDFSNWNAKAIYFYDADHNIVELIARRNLNYPDLNSFGGEALLELCEIGLPVDDFKGTCQYLNEQLQIPIYSGNMETFGAIGDEQGLFIVIDKNKRKWFPKGDEAPSADFEVLIDLSGKKERLFFEKGILRNANRMTP